MNMIYYFLSNSILILLYIAIANNCDRKIVYLFKIFVPILLKSRNTIINKSFKLRVYIFETL